MNWNNVFGVTMVAVIAFIVGGLIYQKVTAPAPVTYSLGFRVGADGTPVAQFTRDGKPFGWVKMNPGSFGDSQ